MTEQARLRGESGAGRPFRLSLLLWLLVLGYLSIALGFAFGHLTPDDGMNIEHVQFHTPGQNYDLALSRSALWLMGGFNQFSVFLLWSVLYLAWKAFEGRRQLQRQVRDARMQLLAAQLAAVVPSAAVRCTTGVDGVALVVDLA